MLVAYLVLASPCVQPALGCLPQLRGAMIVATVPAQVASAAALRDDESKHRQPGHH